MDGRLAFGAVLAIPLLYGLLHLLTGWLPPLVGAGLGLVAYWATLGAVLARQDRDGLLALAQARSPGRLAAVLLALPVIALGAVTMRLLGTVVLPAHLLLAAGLAAILHAVLEELFWRGALWPRPDPGPAALALGLYWAFHLAWLGAQGVSTGLAPHLAVMAPLALGGVWTAARLLSGTLGVSILAHAGLNLFLFTGLLAQSGAAG
ncbi:CPBP family glutamic-type intramembrane protease [Rubellimicrobium roseum]|uniref:CPBP family intramembrane metalloprotease n=1 Tax=Rubellimicrobium roseum TaxID=687525 RepID=A0A5C4NIX7_9RHOB|nr:CPBP family glutamic-type intramembrane protease [Rubellimicrobium roseum]TNC73016.1 CPBP family intramembrane metalloprotease [Rubellimicrobium roseum]